MHVYAAFTFYALRLPDNFNIVFEIPLQAVHISVYDSKTTLPTMQIK